VFFLLSLWCVCVLIAFASLYFRYGIQGGVFDALVVGHMTSVLSIPYSILMSLSSHKVIGRGALLSFSMVFWPTYIYLYFQFLKEYQIVYLFLFVVIAIWASFNWFVASYIMMGI
jgi:hypothetical protein